MHEPSLAKHYVELRLLRYVMTVAEELHFGRAAKRLNVSAPALSKQIKDLESVLGYALFERKTREVIVTAAGMAFTAESRLALAHVERAVVRGFAASRAEMGALSIGYSPWFRPSLLIALQSAFAASVQGNRLELHSAYSSIQIDLLLKGALQAGIIELPSDQEGINTEPLWRDELVIALPENHSLAINAEIDLEDLADEAIVWITRALHPGLHQHFLDSCQSFRYAPRIVYEINTVSELFDLVAVGAGIGFVKASSVEGVRQAGVVLRRVKEAKLFIDTGVAYRSDNRSEALQSLLQLLRERAT